MANDIAVRLDREGLAEMSCIAGVGGDVGPIVQLARSGRRVIAVDGCPLACAKSCLDRHQIEISVHAVLTRFGVGKNLHQDYDPREAERARGKIAALISNGQER